MKHVYLILTVLGVIAPYTYFWDFLREHGLSMGLFVELLFVNDATGGITMDLTFSCLVFWLMLYRDKAVKMKWLAVALTVCVGLCAALPFYLYRKEID